MKKAKFNVDRDDKRYKKDIICDVIEVPLYRCDVKILRDRKEKEKFDKYWERKSNGYNACTYNYLETDNTVLVVFEKEETPRISDVVHELTHATQNILTYVGVEYDGISESFAYLLTYLVEEFYKK